MAEPPAKRARRTDSSAMWEENSNPASTRGGREGHSKVEETNGERHDRDRRDGRRDRERGHRDGRNGDHRPRGREDGDKDRRRDRSRSKDRSRRDDPRPRSRSPHRDSRNGTARTRSPPRGPRSDRDRHRDPPDRKPPTTDSPSQRSSRPVERAKKEDDPDVKMDGGAGELDELDEEGRMLKIMGFGGFRSTKNTKVPGNDKNYGVRKEKKNTYRQYMNRQGGFNRPLSPS